LGAARGARDTPSTIDDGPHLTQERRCGGVRVQPGWRPRLTPAQRPSPRSRGSSSSRGPRAGRGFRPIRLLAFLGLDPQRDAAVSAQDGHLLPAPGVDPQRDRRLRASGSARCCFLLGTSAAPSTSTFISMPSWWTASSCPIRRSSGQARQAWWSKRGRTAWRCPWTEPTQVGIRHAPQGRERAGGEAICTWPSL